MQAVLSAGGILGGVLAGTFFVRHPIRSGTPLLLALSGVCAALGLALRVSVLQFGSILVLGAVFMAVAALFNVWFFAQLQVLVPQAQLGKTTACLSVLACLTQPIGQAAYGSASSTGLRTRQMYCCSRGAFGAGSLAAANAPYRLTQQKGAAVAAPFVVCLFRQLCRVEIAFALLYLHMDVALLGALAADSATVPSFCPAVTVSPAFTAGSATPHSRQLRPAASSSTNTVPQLPSAPADTTLPATGAATAAPCVQA